MRYLLFALFFLYVVQSKLSTFDKILKDFGTKPSKELFKAWHLLFDRSYSLASEEAILRYKIFKDNLNYINEFNSNTENTFELGIGLFTDMSPREYREKYLIQNEVFNNLMNNTKITEKHFLGKLVEDESTKLNNFEKKTKIDWTHTFVKVKEQGKCRASWAFVTSSVCESFINRKFNETIELSPQYLIECSVLRNVRCNYAVDLNRPLTYVVNNGISTEQDYPYESINGYELGNCETGHKIIPINGTIINTSGNLTNAILNSPVIVMIDASSMEFMHYKRGYYNNLHPCYFNHNMIAVKFNGKSFTVQNSFGVGWGEDGYMKILHSSYSEIEINPSYALN